MKTVLKSIVSRILIWESKKVLARYKPRVVAITGSVGKTSTKDVVAHVLGSRFKVRKSEKSFNSEIGLPLTVLGLPNAWSNPLGWVANILHGLSLILFPHDYPEMLVLEVGADRPGDIRRVATWLAPEMSIITYIGALPVHVEFFPSPKDLADEKGSLARAAGKGKILLLNNDDEVVRGMKEGSEATVLTYGFGPGADLAASEQHLYYEKGGEHDVPAGTIFTVLYEGQSYAVRLPHGVGRQAVYGALAAFAAGTQLGIDPEHVIAALLTFEGPPGRMKLLPGIKKTLIVDDTYNASPVAVEAALEVLGGIEMPGRKIAVLGDMMELGKYTIDAHKAAGFQVARNAEYLFTVGQRARFIADGALAEGMKESKIKSYDDSRAAGLALQDFLKKGDLVLVKGSQYVRMERAVLEVMAEPERAEQLLVRQEKEWQNR
ncbi:MAG: UDP-N-acetylmuramoyl-tripeptide--D-alanyl-D-alanine ligase [Patescibacteria group bacterium]